MCHKKRLNAVSAANVLNRNGDIAKSAAYYIPAIPTQ